MKKYFPYFYFLVSCFAIFLLLYPAREGRFVVGFATAPYIINHFISWTDLFKCKFDIAYHLVYHIFLYFACKIFQIHANRWLLLSSILQAAILASSFVLFKKILTKANISHAFGIALSGSLLFFFSPYMCEILVWGATYHYLISVLSLIICWLLLIRYIETAASKYLWWSHVSFFVSIYSLEIGIVFPVMLAIYLGLWTKKPQVNLRQAIIIFLPQFLIIFSYFAMNRIILGNWVGHYGAAVHLYLAPAYMASQFACYLLKYAGLVHFFQYSTRDKLYSFVQQNAIGYILVLCLYLIPLLLFIISYKKNKVILKTGLLLYSFACLALLPLQNLYFMYLFQSENDRLGYFFSLFLYAVIAYTLVKSFKWFGYLVLLVYGFAEFHFLKIEINNWRQSGNVMQSLIREYKWANNPGKVHILTAGDNLNGAFILRNYSDSSYFAKCYEVRYKKECTPLQLYSTMTMSSENDSVRAKVINDSTIQVDLLTGNWLMKDGLGITDYKTTDATIVVSKQQPSFQITFNKKHPGDVYIYESGLHWIQVNGF